MTQDSKTLGQLLGETTRSWRALLDRRLKPLGLSGARWLVLLHTSHAGRELTQTELAERLGIGRSSLVGLLDRMTQDGWVERRPHDTDRRRNLVHLSPRAVEAMATVEAEARQVYEQLVAGLDPADIAVTRRVLHRIRKRAERLERS